MLYVFIAFVWWIRKEESKGHRHHYIYIYMCVCVCVCVCVKENFKKLLFFFVITFISADPILFKMLEMLDKETTKNFSWVFRKTHKIPATQSP